MTPNFIIRNHHNCNWIDATGTRSRTSMNMKNDNHKSIGYHNNIQYIMMLCSVLVMLCMLHDSNVVSLRAT